MTFRGPFSFAVLLLVAVTDALLAPRSFSGPLPDFVTRFAGFVGVALAGQKAS